MGRCEGVKPLKTGVSGWKGMKVGGEGNISQRGGKGHSLVG